MENSVENFFGKCLLPEVRSFYAFLTLRSEFYSAAIGALIPDADPENRVLLSAQYSLNVRIQANWVNKHISFR